MEEIMTKVTKSMFAFFLTFSLIFSALPLYGFAETNNAIPEKIMVSSESEETVPLLNEDKMDSEVLASIPNQTELTVLEKGSNYTYVSYADPETNTAMQGFVKNGFIIGQKDPVAEQPVEEPVTAITSQQSAHSTNKTEGNTSSSNTEKSKNTAVTGEKGATRASVSATQDSSQTDETTQGNDAAAANVSPAAQLITGIALKNPTQIYSQTNEDSKVLKSYPQGTLLKYESFTDSWYKCTVFINGRGTTGFIKKSDVENGITPQVWKTGVVLNNGIGAYSRASTASKVLKTYVQGTVLKYKTFTSGWYQSSVYVNGKATLCYFRKSDLENTITPQKSLSGITKYAKISVHAKASTSSKVLKSYAQGTLLKYKTFSSQWYQSTVYINGKATVCYIRKSDVENAVSQQEWLKGITVNSRISVFSRASTSSKVLKSYLQGTVLSYKTFTSGWYQSTVYINGKATTCYIKKSDVENAVLEQNSLRGVTRYTKINVYSRASSSSTVLKAYAQGSVLAYNTFTSGWYQSTVFINGKKVTCYIRKSDVQNAINPQLDLEGLTMKQPVSIYSKASASSSILRNYKKGVILKFSTLTGSWYECTIFISDKATKGYIKAGDMKVLEDDINFVRESTKYGLSMDDALDMQMKVNPQTDSSGSWGKASRSEVEYYLNPANFSQTSTAYYQFVVLSAYAGSDVSELNEKILTEKGILEGKGSSYISAAKQYGVNEIYLVSHSLLETGNGLSQLANGVMVNGVMVYNVYGIGAIDSDPLGGGSQYAYEHGWTSVEKAIEGGAQFVAQNYISKGQDTLYKMRWNPDGMEEYSYATHQYASDVGWAVKQTDRIVSMYNQLSRYTLVFDLPKYYL
jgi:mannosyl-glycoprotein endo-beta-N-acetylglucosaminidase